MEYKFVWNGDENSTLLFECSSGELWMVWPLHWGWPDASSSYFFICLSFSSNCWCVWYWPESGRAQPSPIQQQVVFIQVVHAAIWFFFAACAAQEGRKKDTKKKNNAHYIIIQWRSWTVVHKCKTDKDTRNERLVFIASDLDGQKQQITNEYKIDDGLKLTSMRFRCGHFLRK